jgi:hypothetical protein
MSKLGSFFKDADGRIRVPFWNAPLKNCNFDGASGLPLGE